MDVKPEDAADTSTHLLDVRDLRVEFHTHDGVVRALNGVSYYVDAGESLAVLGESGSGKSVSAQAIMGILDIPPAKIAGGTIRYRGEDMLKMREDQRRRIRGAEISMVFQDALSALNPVFTVGFQISENLRRRLGMSKSEAYKRAVELMDLVRIPAAKDRVKDFPHQFSGGMRQRVMIAMALALDPAVLIADEPTTALDVTVQAQIMDLLADLRRDLDMALILITHDLGVVADVADRIAVMYAGRIVENANVHDLYSNPGHPYTEGLLASIPRVDLKGQQLRSIKGMPPNMLHPPSGCPFHPRCTYAQDICTQEDPPLRDVGVQRSSACHFAEEVLDGARN